MTTSEEDRGSALLRKSALLRWWQRPEIHRIFWIWVVMTALLVAFAVVPARLMGVQASPTEHDVELTMTVFTIAAAPVAALVWSIAGYSLFAWRHKGPNIPTTDGPAIRSNGPATSLWLIISSVLVTFLLIWGLAEIPTTASAASAPGKLVVNVTGQQWLWTFSYPDEGNVQSDVLYLPENRPVVFHVTSEDVIHSFWVVQLGIKIDANPGEVTQTSVTPTKLGTFDVRCAELCGLYHANMETTAKVVSPANFASWLTAQGGHQ
jgi:cytochrome c oxidase subunit 2